MTARAVASRPSPSIGQVAAVMRLELPSALVVFLRERDITTLADILSAGGLAHLRGLPVPTADPALRALDAQAGLSVLPADVETAARLIAAGYSNLYDIGSAPQSRFAAKVGSAIGEARALALHAAARAQVGYLTSVMAGLRVAAANGSPVAAASSLAGVIPQTCGCQNCQAATSPLAYLADLLDYTVRHVQVSGAAITLDQLAARLCQPFGRLPAACDQLDDQMRQVRICIEVLRTYLSDTSDKPDYLMAAYSKLLQQLGTSYEEIRSARAADDRRVRAPLAARLGFGLRSNFARPDHLDDLLLGPDRPQYPNDPRQLTEQNLEVLFGLASTIRDPLLPGPTPALQTWRLERLTGAWQVEDGPSNPGGVRTRPLIDPDVVDAADLRNPTTGDHAYDLWGQRVSWIQKNLGEIRFLWLQSGVSRDQLLQDGQYGLGSGLGANDGPDVNAVDVAYLKMQRGGDIQTELARWLLDADAFAYLGSIIHIEKIGLPVLAGEWENLFSILLQRIKVRDVLQAWIGEEQQASPPVTLGPDWFGLRPTLLDTMADCMSADAGTDWIPVSWRSTMETRRQWVDALRARLEQQHAAIAGLQDAVRVTEEATLTGLRGLLLIESALPGVLTADDVERLTRRLQIDCQAGACDTTTRIAQAIETLQGFLFGLRNGLVDDATLTLDAAEFDQEWSWIGSYATWRAAMLVFLYPENALFPILRHRQSPGFRDLVATCQQLGRLDPPGADQVAEQYGQYFADVCSLRFAGLCRTSGLLPGAVVPDTDPADAAPFHPDVLAVGRGGATGRFYWSVWHWDLSGTQGGADETMWDRVQGVGATAELVGMVPYHGATDEVHAGLYFRSRAGTDTFAFAAVDGASPVSASAIDSVPALVCGAAYGGSLPPSAALAAAGGGGWPLLSGDQPVVLDVDGDGRDEVVLIAGTSSGGRRQVGLLREYGGGLVLDWKGTIDSGWHLPDPTNPVTYVAGQPSGGPGYRWGLLLVSSAGPQPEVGTLAWSPVTGLSISWTAANVPHANGTPGWQVNLTATVDQKAYPTVFLTADLDGVGTWVLAFEYAGTGSSYTPVRTTVTAFLVSASGTFSVAASQAPRQDLYLPLAADPARGGDPTEHAVAWTTICPSRTGTIVLAGSRLEKRLRQGRLVWEEHVVMVPLQWRSGQFVLDRTSPQLPTLFDIDYDAVAGDATRHVWILHADDQLIAAGSQYVVVYSLAASTDADPTPSRCLGVLSYTATGSLVCEAALKRGDVVPPTVVGGSGWNIQPGDTVATGLPLLLVRADGTSIGSLVVQSDQTLAVDWVVDGRVLPPGGLDGVPWSLAAPTTFTVANLAADDSAQLVSWQDDGAGDVRTAVLRPVPPPRPRVYGQLPARYGPVAVTALDISAPFSDTQLPSRAAVEKAAYLANESAGGVNLVYLDEGYYFVPVEIARRLAQAGFFTAALDWFRTVYDFRLPAADRIIAYKLLLDALSAPGFTRPLNWLRDPLNPHAIAETRSLSYTRYTIIEVVACLLAYADSEYTRANAESVPRARALYIEALDLLAADAFQPDGTTCASVLGSLDIQVGEGFWKLLWSAIVSDLRRITNLAVLSAVVAAVGTAMKGEGALDARLARARDIVGKALQAQPPAPPFAEVVVHGQQIARAAAPAVLADPAVAEAAARVGRVAAGAFPLPVPIPVFVLPPSFTFCIPQNASIDTFQRHARLNLCKIRGCRNIAGFQQQLDPYMLPNAQEASLQTLDVSGQLPVFNMPALQPLPYRFATLIDRTKQLVQLAQQIEDKLLTAIVNQDAQAYDELKARQDLALAQAGVRLKDLQLVAASDGVGLAQLQRDRAQITFKHYSALLEAGLSDSEQLSLEFIQGAVVLQQMRAAIDFGSAIGQFTAGDASGAAQAMLGGMESQAQVFSTESGFFANLGTYERRTQEWQLQQQLAGQEIGIGDQQVQIARDQVLVAAQDRAIAFAQIDNAEAVLSFIVTGRFANGALYEWMAGVLQQVYRFFLQQATSMAQLAEFQLAFERQQLMPAFIQADYWQPPAGSAFAAPARSGVTALADTRGLTGAERLSEDITALDQYAFQTDQRKLQLTRTISLSQLDPFAFQLFRQTGVLRFATPLELFDQDYPGHYLRLVKRVTTSVVALIPPSWGIRATLSTTGTSRVVIGGDSFQTVVLQRGPEEVALSSPSGATGLFALDVQADMLAPFEGIGVATNWEFQMPKSANPFDYGTIADVLVSIDYTALSSPDYRQQVLRQRDQLFSADRGYSFRYQFADQWYELHHPQQSATPLIVMFTTERGDFLPNLIDRPHIVNVVLYFAPSDGQSFELASVDLQPAAGAGGQANTVNQVISIRGGSGANWVGMVGQPADQQWTLDLSATGISDLFASDAISDILFVITYEGNLPSWPA